MPGDRDLTPDIEVGVVTATAYASFAETWIMPLASSIRNDGEKFPAGV